jgi:imidazole glycerol phosphate synthase glutamine amidotransferase subunit
LKVTVIDHGAGNVASVERALARIGVASERAVLSAAISSAKVLILPGVGHFSALVRALDQKSLRVPLLDALARGVPFLGICLGLQALYESSDESPDSQGLGVLRGTIRLLPAHLKLPHMGWNRIHALGPTRLFRGIPAGSYFYFAHSFAAPYLPPEAAAATCTYGSEFVAAIERDNLFAVQFHPEKSGAAGEQLLRNFVSQAL